MKPLVDERPPAGGDGLGVGEVGGDTLDIGLGLFETGTRLCDRCLGDGDLRLDVAHVELGEHLAHSHPVALIGTKRDQHARDLEADIGLDPRADRAKPEHLLPHIRLHGRNRHRDRAEEGEPGQERSDSKGDHGG